MEANNMAAMREALKRLLNLAYEVQDLNSEDGPKTSVPAQFVIDVAKSALSAPARNCDVGTASQQAERFNAFCGGKNCLECTLFPDSRCEMAWMQMSYEDKEGGL